MATQPRDDTPGSGEAVAGPAVPAVTAPSPTNTVPAPRPNPGVAPVQVDGGDTLVRTRPGYAFQGSTVDVPITFTGVRVTRTQADEIVAEAEAHGEVVTIDETPEG